VLESIRMAKLSVPRWPGVICLTVLLGACAHARIVHRDFPYEPSPPARPTASTPPPAATHAIAPTPATQRPVETKPLVPETVPQNGTYIVKTGDTLYGIARRFGLKFKDLVDWNRIAEPYAIQSGQRLHLHSPDNATTSVAPTPGVPATTTQKTVVQNRTLPAVQKGLPPVVEAAPATTSASEPPKPSAITANAPTVSSPASSASVASTPIAGTSLPSTPKPRETVSPPKPVNSSASPAVTAVPIPSVAPATPVSVGVAIPGGPSWRWPTDGEIIGRYVAGDQTQQGIDISGHSGQPVIAAADGVVVYSGAGLVGYGELVIIKHSNEWLSAYAHNRRRLVAEGTKVKAGDAIAEMGRTGAISDMLHFEIRRNGKPVDPLLYLPKR